MIFSAAGQWTLDTLTDRKFERDIREKKKLTSTNRKRPIGRRIDKDTNKETEKNTEIR